MIAYLVGGAIRDRLLGRAVTDRDWLLTNASSSQLKALGYRNAGQHFEVYLHPQTHEEYALPRQLLVGGETQREQVEGDLALRDLTINAIAESPQGELIDPYNGQQDIQDRVLRHLPAFADDPVRALRLARFTARYSYLGFTVAGETRQLVADMKTAGAFQQMVPERVVAEFSKALNDSYADVFFQSLRELGLLEVLLPELDRLFGVPQPEKYHPEVDTGIHALMVLQQACLLTGDVAVRIAALLHDVGKGTTPKEEWPRHIAHEERGARLLETLAARLRFPSEWKDLCVLSSRFHTRCHRCMDMKPASIMKLLEGVDAFRRGERFEQFLLVCEADARGRTGFEQKAYPQADVMRAALQAALRVDTAEIASNCSSGKHIAEQVRIARIAAIRQQRAA